MPVVTALRPAPHGLVGVELDGRPWRTLPVDVVARVPIRVGAALDRPCARALRRELRRAEALGAAARALRRRDHSHATLDTRLRRAGVAGAEREAALATLERAGYLDDARFAERRAQELAARHWGNAAIAADLERQGLDADVRAEALATLEPESLRVQRVAERRGAVPKTAAYLARRGFDEEAVEQLVARDA